MTADIPVVPFGESVTATSPSENEGSAEGQKSSQTTKRKKPEKTTTIQTACMYCRGSKMRCIRDAEDEDCKRCIAAGIKCETFARKSGRKPGQGTKRSWARVNGKPTDATQSNGNQSSSIPPQMNVPGSGRTPPAPTIPDYDHLQNPYTNLHAQLPLGNNVQYEGHQSFGIPEHSVQQHVTFQKPQAGHNTYNSSYQAHMFQMPSMQTHHPSLNSNFNQQSSLHQLSEDTMINNPNHSGVPSSSTFNSNQTLPTQQAINIPSNLFLPSFAALTSEPSTTTSVHTTFAPDPRMQSSTAFASTSFDGSKKSEGSQHNSTGWTPISSGSNHDDVRQTGQPSLTITPLDMLATVGMKGKRAAALSNPSFELPSLDELSRAYTEPPSIPLVKGLTSRSKMANTIGQAEYFSSLAMHDLDYEPDYDPIGLSLVTEEEAREIFAYYFDHINPMNPLLDPVLHGYDRLSHRGTFLLTSIMAVGTKFMAQFAAAAQRLDDHLRKVVIPSAIMDGHTSLEIVAGFMVLAPYVDAGRHISLDITGTFLAVAHDRFKRLPKPSPDTSKEASMQRRAYERAHLILFCYERGFALISGQSLGYLVPEPELASTLQDWTKADSTVQGEFDLAALSALRHGIPDILRIIAPTRPPGQEYGQVRVASPAIIKAVTTEMLNDWRATWLSSVTAKAYLNIVECHTALSLWITALRGHVGHPTETAILQQALLAAIQTLQAVVGADAESLRFMVNNTFVMVAYAAAFTLRLLARWAETAAPVEGSISALIAQVANCLQQAGTTPAHRFGRSWMYGQRLHEMLRDRMQSRRASRAPTPAVQPQLGQGDDQGHQQQSSLPRDATLPTAVGAQSGIYQFPEDDSLDIANMSPDKVDKLLSEYTWFPLEASAAADDFLDWEAFFAG